MIAPKARSDQSPVSGNCTALLTRLALIHMQIYYSEINRPHFLEQPEYRYEDWSSTKGYSPCSFAETKTMRNFQVKYLATAETSNSPA